MKPSIALLACLVAVAAAASVRKPITERYLLQGEVKTRMQEALVGTRLTLAGKSHLLLEEQVLQKNLDWGLNNSVHQALSGFLRAGEVDALQLLNPQCQMLAEAQLRPSAAPDCSAQGFIWRLDAKTPVLGLLQPFTLRNETYFLYSEVSLAATWLRGYPRLAGLMQKLSASIGPAAQTKGRVLMVEGWSGDQALAVLSSADFWLNATPMSLMKLTDWLDDFIVIWLCGTAALFLLTLVAHQRELMQWRKDKTQFLQWCGEFLKNKVSEYEDAKKGFLAFEDKGRQDLRKQKDQTRELQLKAAQLQERLMQAERMEGDYSQLDSLLLQMQGTAPVLQEQMQKIHSSLEDLGDSLRVGLTRPAQELAGYLHQWQKGLQLATPRKFFRGLSETVNIDGRTALETQLMAMQEAVQAVLNMAVNAMMLSGKVNHRFERITRQVRHWTLLAHKEPSYQVHHLDELILNCQDTLQASVGRARMRFDNKLGGRMGMPMVAIPDQLWLSVFFHLYLAEITDIPTTEDVTVQTVVRQRDLQTVLVISGDQDKDAPRPYSEAAMAHVHIAQKMLRGHAVKLNLLPRLQGGNAGIALSFQQEQRGEEVVL